MNVKWLFISKVPTINSNSFCIVLMIQVNLFVDHSQILQLECLRSGIWGTKSTWGRMITFKPQPPARVIVYISIMNAFVHSILHMIYIIGENIIYIVHVFGTINTKHISIYYTRFLISNLTAICISRSLCCFVPSTIERNKQLKLVEVFYVFKWLIIVYNAWVILISKLHKHNLRFGDIDTQITMHTKVFQHTIRLWGNWKAFAKSNSSSSNNTIMKTTF